MVLWPRMMDAGHPEIDACSTVPLTSRWVWAKWLKCKNTKSEKVSGVSLVRKIKLTSPFLTASPIEAVRDALTGRRSAVRTATKTRRCDLWGCPAPSKSRLNSCVFSGTASLREGGLLLFFDTRVHTGRNKELYSPLIGCVWETCPASITLQSPDPPWWICLFCSCQRVKYGQMKTQTHQWMKPVHSTHTQDMAIHTESLKSPTATSNNDQNCSKISGLIYESVRKKKESMIRICLRELSNTNNCIFIKHFESLTNVNIFSSSRL